MWLIVPRWWWTVCVWRVLFVLFVLDFCFVASSQSPIAKRIFITSEKIRTVPSSGFWYTVLSACEKWHVICDWIVFTHCILTLDTPNAIVEIPNARIHTMKKTPTHLINPSHFIHTNCFTLINSIKIDFKMITLRQLRMQPNSALECNQTLRNFPNNSNIFIYLKLIIYFNFMPVFMELRTCSCFTQDRKKIKEIHEKFK